MHKILMVVILVFIAGDYAMSQVVTPPPEGCGVVVPPTPPDVSTCSFDGALVIGYEGKCKIEFLTTDAQRAAAKAIPNAKLINSQAGRKYFEERWVKLKTPLANGWNWPTACERQTINWKRTGAPNNMGLPSSMSVNCKNFKILSKTVRPPVGTAARTEEWFARVVWAQPMVEPTQADIDSGSIDWAKFVVPEGRFAVWREGELLTGTHMDARQTGPSQITTSLVSAFLGQFISYPVVITDSVMYYDVVPIQ